MIGDIPRILRLPDTVNHKYHHKPICEVVEINDKCIYTRRLSGEGFLLSFEKSMVDTSTVNH